MKFKYARRGNVVRPVIPIKLKKGDAKVGYEVLVDSGADFCIFSDQVGETIGIDTRKGEKREIFGVGGKSSVCFWNPVEIEVGGRTFKIEACFMPDVSGKVVQHGIVGQKGFFEHFVVKFDYTKEQIELKPKK